MMLTGDDLRIGNWQVMRRWETPLMKVLAREASVHHGDILEVGFGMGISADAILAHGCRSYTAIEAHPKVADLARRWAEHQATHVRIIEGYWQDVVPNLVARYDGILFDTYPMSRRERHKNHFPFIPVAPQLLREGGFLTLYSDETIDFRPQHLKLLLTHFDEVKLIKVTGLTPPADCEYWQSDLMVIPVARKGSRVRQRSPGAASSAAASLPR